jgi:hypothetical protein
VAVGDFNLDGKPDLVAPNWNFANQNNVSVLLNDCTPANSTPTITAFDLTRQQGAVGSNSKIATVSDTEDAEDDLVVTVNGSLLDATVRFAPLTSKCYRHVISSPLFGFE